MQENGNTLKYRVSRLEEGYGTLDDKVDRIMTNHLPHINEELIALKTRVTVASLVNIGAIVAAILLSKYL